MHYSSAFLLDLIVPAVCWGLDVGKLETPLLHNLSGIIWALFGDLTGLQALLPGLWSLGELRWSCVRNLPNCPALQHRCAWNTLGTLKNILGVPRAKYPLESWLSGLFPWILALKFCQNTGRFLLGFSPEWLAEKLYNFGVSPQGKLHKSYWRVDIIYNGKQMRTCLEFSPGWYYSVILLQ